MVGGFSPRSYTSYISDRGVDIWGIQCFLFWNAFPVYSFVCVPGGERGPYFTSPGMNDDAHLVSDSTGLWGYMLHCKLYSLLNILVV